MPIFFIESWSLAIEEWAYIILPILIFSAVWLLKAIQLKYRILVPLISLIIIEIGCRIVFWTMYIVGHDASEAWFLNYSLRQLTYLRIDTIVFGVLAAWFFVFTPQLWHRYKWQFFCVGALLYLLIPSINTYLFTDLTASNGWVRAAFGTCIACVCIGLTLPVLSAFNMSSNYFSRFVELISKISYSMYLFNYSILITLLKGLINPTTVLESYGCLALYWILLIGVSWLTYTYFELPVTELRNRFLRRETMVDTDHPVLT